MGERFFINSKNGVGFRVGRGVRPVEKFQFVPQAETLQSFLAGKGHPKDNHLEMTIKGANDSIRTEVWHRHESGFMDGDVRILKIVAHPDDTGLDSGAAYLAVNVGKVDGDKKTRFGVITATPGQKGVKKHESDEEILKDASIGKIRMNEDVEGTRLLGADFVANLGFMDGDVSNDEDELEERIFHYLTKLRPQVVSLADIKDPAHEDHKAVTRATLRALRRSEQKPIVIYNEYQNGNKTLTPDHVAYRLTHDEYRAVWQAFFVHTSQTRTMSDDIRDLMDRPFRNADMLGLNIPIGIFRQDPEFSHEPFGNLLGDRVIPIPQAESELRELLDRLRKIDSTRIDRNPTIIFDNNSETAQDGPLEYGLALTNEHLLTPQVLESIKTLDQPHNIIVTQIDPVNAENPAFFAKNDIPLSAVAKCLVVKINGRQKYAAIVVPGDTRADLNGKVLQELGARRVSLAPHTAAAELTGMEPGSISPLGLPNDWQVLVDDRLVNQIQIMVGSGMRGSKMVMPGFALEELSNVSIIEGLGMIGRVGKQSAITASKTVYENAFA